MSQNLLPLVGLLTTLSSLKPGEITLWGAQSGDHLARFDHAGSSDVPVDVAACTLSADTKGFYPKSEEAKAQIADYEKDLATRVREGGSAEYDAGKSVTLVIPELAGATITAGDNKEVRFNSAGYAVCGLRTALTFKESFPNCRIEGADEDEMKDALTHPDEKESDDDSHGEGHYFGDDDDDDDDEDDADNYDPTQTGRYYREDAPVAVPDGPLKNDVAATSTDVTGPVEPPVPVENEFAIESGAGIGAAKSDATDGENDTPIENEGDPMEKLVGKNNAILLRRAGYATLEQAHAASFDQLKAITKLTPSAISKIKSDSAVAKA